MASPLQYTPGVCNIGPAEIRKRRAAGWVGLAATLALEGVFVGWHVPAGYRLLLFLPATQAASGFYQAAFHFCVGFGFKSVFNFGPTGTRESVETAEFRLLDRRRAAKLLGGSVATGAVVAAVAALTAS